MAITYNLIETATVSAAGGAASFEFVSIPQTYTDLLIVYSGRSATAAVGDDVYIRFNGLSTNLSSRYFYGNGASVSSSAYASTAYVGYIPAASATGSVFGNASIYIPSYTAAVNKSMSCDSVTENNGTTAWTFFNAALWSATAAITQINIYSANGNFVQHSSASLYGIKNS